MSHPVPTWRLRGVITFVAALLLRAQHDAAALGLIAAAWLIIPVLALSDRIVFDGALLRRHGPLASLLKLLFGYRKQLAVDDFETVETQRCARCDVADAFGIAIARRLQARAKSL